MGGGGHSTTHHETKIPNDYDDAWIHVDMLLKEFEID